MATAYTKYSPPSPTTLGVAPAARATSNNTHGTVGLANHRDQGSLTGLANASPVWLKILAQEGVRA